MEAKQKRSFSLLGTTESIEIYSRQKQPFKGFPRKRCSENMPADLQENGHAEVQSNFIEIILRHGCSPVNLLHIFRRPFPNNTSGGLLLSRKMF